ncbi:MAG: winged helix-turn-helix domain-containing protein [Vicinamibacteria bacterium]
MSESALEVQRVGVGDDGFAVQPPLVRASSSVLGFGVFELDRLTSELRKEGRLIHLRLQPASVLRLLLERAGELVTRHEITNQLWPDDVDVDVEQGLNHCMKEIRAALGDRPDSPRFIQTLPRRGYRFLVEVRETRETASTPPSETGQPQTTRETTETTKPPSQVDPESDQGLSDGRFE